MECSAKEVFLVWDFVVFTSVRTNQSCTYPHCVHPGICFWIITVLDELFQAAQEHMGSYDHIQQCIGRLSDPFYAISNALVHDFCTLQSRFQLFLYTLATLLAIGICVRIQNNKKREREKKRERR
ncbi:hypothetical protein BCR43DRAFT_498353 [Syncephalastrum racemosum]|uniref:Uncharacterized protein n=1 Tax=Syncephalastrum racemosum TaxID=13706 RepID=A0A1X2H0P6_SYNRA|nr:hypothetical protein BCR43DRAFT_498353 [Syncephalastrum racemosum]